MPSRFVKGSFRSKKVNNDIVLIVGELKPEFQHLSGGGFGDYFKRAYSAVSGAVSSVGNKIVNAFTIHDYSTKTKRNLELYGDLPVVALEIRRKPLNIAIELAFQGVSAGQWADLKKKYGFDKFYHLSAVVTLKKEDTKQMAFEKLEVISFNDNIGYKEGDGTEILPVEVTKSFTVAEMFDKTRKTVGDDRFFSYSGVGGNNCQDFIAMCLTSVGLYGAKEKAFTYQDMKALTDELPLKVKAVARGVTQIGAIANKFLGIGGNQFFDEEYENEIPHSLNSIIGRMKGGMRDRKTELLIGDYVDFLGRRGLTPQESRDIANMYVRQLLDTNDRKKLRVIRKHIQNDMESQRESGLNPIPEIDGYGMKGGVLPTFELTTTENNDRTALIDYWNNNSEEIIKSYKPDFEVGDIKDGYSDEDEGEERETYTLDEYKYAAFEAFSRDHTGIGGELTIITRTKKGQNDAITFLRNIKELILEKQGKMYKQDTPVEQQWWNYEGDGKSKTQQFYKYVMAHKHDLKAKHTLEQMFIDWKESKK